jgi:hypothetical protein
MAGAAGDPPRLLRSPLDAVHMLFPIGANRLFIDKMADLIETGFIVAYSGQELRQHLHDKLFLLALVKIKYSGFQFVVSHGCSPSAFLIRRIAEN